MAATPAKWGAASRIIGSYEAARVDVPLSRMFDMTAKVERRASFGRGLAAVLVGVVQLAWSVAAAASPRFPDAPWLVRGMGSGLIISGVVSLWNHRR